MNGVGNAPNSAVNNFEFRALTVVDINSQKVFREQAFSWGKRFTIPSSAVGGGVYDIHIDLTAIESDKTCVILPVAFSAMDAGPIFGDLYINPTITAETGTVTPGGNRDNRSSRQPKAIVTIAPIVTDVGIKVPGAEFMIMSNGTSAVATFGGQAKDDLILIANCDFKYMFRLTNQEANPAYGSFSLTMFEAELNV